MNSIDTSNLVDGLPVYYLVNQTGLVINPVSFPQIGYLALVNCNNITVEHLTLTNLLSTVVFAYVSNSKIAANNIVSVRNGVDFDNCSSNEITGNSITVPYNPEAFQNYGLSVSASVNNTITGNTIIGGFSSLLLGTNVTQYNDIYGNTVSSGLQSSTNQSATQVVPHLVFYGIIAILVGVIVALLIVMAVMHWKAKTSTRISESQKIQILLTISSCA